MNARRIFILLRKELVSGPKNFFFIFAVAVPVITSLVISLLFGELFSGKPQVGLFAPSGSQLVDLVLEADYVVGSVYESVAELKTAVSTGAVDMGLALPNDFDTLLQANEHVDATLFVHGQSLLKNRIVIGGLLGNSIVAVGNRDLPVSVQSVSLGQGNNTAWYERMVPLLVLMAVVLGGSIVPAGSLVEEKQNRTLGALTATPTSPGDVFLAKGLLGVMVSIVMGIVILLLNRAFGVHPGLLIFILLLSAMLAATFGILLGSLTKDVNALFAVVKVSGALLYAPALIYLFPDVPQWIARVFPTYYIIGPIIEITQNGGSWSTIWPDVTILMVLIGLMLAGLALVINRTRFRPA